MCHTLNISVGTFGYGPDKKVSEARRMIRGRGRPSLHRRMGSVVGALTAIGRRPINTFAHAGRTERTVLLEEPETLDAELFQEEEEEKKAKAEAEKARPGLTKFMDASRLDDGAAGYALVWKNGQCWAGIKTHMGYN